nr:RNA-directed DNA polymerase, eukaryota, reverse transcriptase zinc-binding domain protein [Tanacetum cinerariifolium]
MIQWIMTCVSSAAFTISVNGERFGYFKGGRGLRQGDPISPDLFTLVMEVFSLIMSRNVQNSPDFKYHVGCKELKLTHLIFADDLLVLCHGDLKSISVLKKALNEFSKVFGLVPNINKSVVFFGNVDKQAQRAILDELSFMVGTLPVKYLGVPLITKKIGVAECKILMYKVKNVVLDWKNKSLSYAGRLQLISSVLASMQVYWASVFLISKTTIRDIEKVLKGFLWCSGDLQKGKAKVSWKIICTLKDQGPLCSMINKRAIYNARLSDNNTVADMNDKCDKGCDYSNKIWKGLKGNMYADKLSDDWIGVINDLVQMNNNNAIRSILRRIVVALTVYYVWQERNKRIMANEFRSADVLFKNILEYVKLKIMSLKVKLSVQVRKVAKEWDVMVKEKI